MRARSGLSAAAAAVACCAALPVIAPAARAQTVAPESSCAAAGPGAVRAGEVQRGETRSFPGGLPYEYRTRLPELAGAPAAGAVNDAVRRAVDGEVEAFVARGAGIVPPPTGTERSQLMVHCASSHLTPQVFSVVLQLTSYYQGGAHFNTWYVGVTVDLQTGRRLAAVDLFRPGADWVTAVTRGVYGQDKALCGALGVRRLRSEVGRAASPPDPQGAPAPALALGPAGLVVAFTQGMIGPSACGGPAVVIPYAALAADLNPALTALPAPSQEPDGPCVLASVTQTGGGHVTAWSIFAGGQGSVGVSHRSDGSFDLGLRGRLRVGGKLSLGAKVSGRARGRRGGAGANGEIALGLQGAVGMTARAQSEDDVKALVAMALTGRGPAAGTRAELADVSVEMGVWLTAEGNAGVGSDVEGSLSLEGVIGAKVAYQRAQPVAVTYYLAVRGNVGGSAGLPAAPSGTSPELSAAVSAERLVELTVDADGRPVSASIGGSVGVAGTHAVKLKDDPVKAVQELGEAAKRKRSRGGSATSGAEVAVSSELDLIDPENDEAFSRVISGAPTPAEGARLLRRWTQTATMRVLMYRTSAISANASVSVGRAVSFGLGVEGSATSRELVWAAYLGKGPPRTWSAWTACESKLVGS